MEEHKQDGLIGIIEGKIKITAPVGGGRPPLLIPPDEGAAVYLNGVEIKAPTYCEPHDTITIVPDTFVEEPRVEVKISPDGLFAMAAVFPRVIRSYELEDTGFLTSLKPRLVKKEKIEKAVTLEQLERELSRHNVTAGLDIVALRELVHNADGNFKTVAYGRDKEEGIDGSLEYVINPEVEVIKYENDQKKVDYRERYRFPSIKEGDVIAVIHPPREGKAGFKVTGEAILPKPVKPARVRCGEGVIIASNQKEIIAIKDGRLIVSGNIIKVVNLLIHSSDVNLESGNLRFNGEIRILGNVMEGMLVEARDSLTVEESCYGAVLKSGGGINIRKNMIKSEAQGGLFYALLRELTILLSQLTKELESFVNNLLKVLAGFVEKGQEVNADLVKRVFIMLMAQKAGLRDNLSLLLRKLKGNDYSYLDKMVKALTKLEEIINEVQKDIDVNELIDINKTCNSIYNDCQELLSEIPPFTASYVQNCNIWHSGDIEINGPGCYFSRLQAGGEVRVTGVFRGGSIIAEGNVKVKEFICMTTSADNPDGGAFVHIKVPEHSAIYFTLVREDTKVQIGKMIYRFERDYSKIKISFNPQECRLELAHF